jgi:hypothetical protein
MNDLYGGSYRLFERVRRRSAGLDFTFLDLNDAAALKAALKPNTRMILGRDADQSDADRRRLGEGRRLRPQAWPDFRRRQHILLADPAAPARVRRGP